MTGLGSKDLTKFIQTGVTLPKTTAIKAKCAACMANYADGRLDCHITDCPLHPYMPYKGKNGKKMEENLAGG
jgi:hypothetical protein